VCAGLEGQIRSLVVGMRYPGTVAVSFPVTHSRVVVQNPDRVNKFITSVTGFFAGKRKYEVVKAVWPFATMPRGGEPGTRRCAVQSEEVWWREWKGSIRHGMFFPYLFRVVLVSFTTGSHADVNSNRDEATWLGHERGQAGGSHGGDAVDDARECGLGPGRDLVGMMIWWV